MKPDDFLWRVAQGRTKPDINAWDGCASTARGEGTRAVHLPVVVCVFTLFLFIVLV